MQKTQSVKKILQEFDALADSLRKLSRSLAAAQVKIESLRNPQPKEPTIEPIQLDQKHSRGRGANTAHNHQNPIGRGTRAAR